jgi:hypothetical protein
VELLTEFPVPTEAQQVTFSPLPLSVCTLPGTDTAAVLAGFYQPSRFQAFRNSHRRDLTSRERKALDHIHAAAVEARARRADFDDRPREIEPFVDVRADQIAAQPAFQSSFARRTTHFSWIDPACVVPIQTYIRVRERPPLTEHNIISIALPLIEQPKFEIQQAWRRTFYLTSMSPHAGGSAPIAKPGPGGAMSVTLKTHNNVIQVACIGGELYCVNGTHRLADAARYGLRRVPALVVELQAARDISVHLGVDGFELEDLLKDTKPPRMGEFYGPAAFKMEIDKSLFGATVTFRY